VLCLILQKLMQTTHVHWKSVSLVCVTWLENLWFERYESLLTSNDDNDWKNTHVWRKICKLSQNKEATIHTAEICSDLTSLHSMCYLLFERLCFYVIDRHLRNFRIFKYLLNALRKLSWIVHASHCEISTESSWEAWW